MYKVSIIVPMYNVENYLKDCLNSILNQTIGFENLEVIIVDDNSTDKSFEIAKEFSDKYENVALLKTEKNTGVAGHARNIGLEHVHGEYIMFTDADDFYSLDACETLYNFIKEKDADFVTANYKNADEDGKEWERPIFSQEKYDTFLLDSYDYINSFFVLNSSVCNKIFNAEFVKKNELRFLEGVPAEDAFFSYSSMMCASKIYYNKSVIYFYRVRNASKTLSVSWNCSKNYFENINSAYKSIYNKFLENDRLDYYRFFYAKSMTYMLYKFIDSVSLTEEEKIEVLSEMRWFYKLSSELDVPACQKSLSLIINKIVSGEYKDVIDICGVISDIRKYMSKEDREKMSKPTTEFYKEMLK